MSSTNSSQEKLILKLCIKVIDVFRIENSIEIQKIYQMYFAKYICMFLMDIFRINIQISASATMRNIQNFSNSIVNICIQANSKYLISLLDNARYSATSLSGESGTPSLQNIPHLAKFPA